MELYLWDSTPASVVVNAPPAIAGELAAGDAAFGPLLPPGGVSGMLVQALDAAEAADPQLELPAGTTTDACSPLDNPGAISGRIALVDRG
ncbi:MAG: hypothetical protein GWN73_32490, partial [Actinobacteria bacterium]|nr:hypothetical protein [Actinomycetota bacterium]NIS35122.1 hypothetical protein [Actinomycetota bacterium]NIU69849.1 hypothetical protein [Actinomycetota bacterium]NIW31725.1 hypothetical protein [Actinomycetota bacterium]